MDTLASNVLINILYTNLRIMHHSYGFNYSEGEIKNNTVLSDLFAECILLDWSENYIVPGDPTSGKKGILYHTFYDVLNIILIDTIQK